MFAKNLHLVKKKYLLNLEIVRTTHLLFECILLHSIWIIVNIFKKCHKKVNKTI